MTHRELLSFPLSVLLFLGQVSFSGSSSLYGGQTALSDFRHITAASNPSTEMVPFLQSLSKNAHFRPIAVVKDTQCSHGLDLGHVLPLQPGGGVALHGLQQAFSVANVSCIPKLLQKPARTKHFWRLLVAHHPLPLCRWRQFRPPQHAGILQGAVLPTLLPPAGS